MSLIYTLTNPKKPIIGVHTLLPMFGGFDIETTQMTTEWAIISQLRQLFELKQLDIAADEIGEEIRSYGRANPGKSIIIQDRTTGVMTYLKIGSGR